MKPYRSLASDSKAQMIVLMGFVIAMVIVGMGTVVYSVATSGHHAPDRQSEAALDMFRNICEEYGTILMFSSNYGSRDPFSASGSQTDRYESGMKTILASHGYIVDFIHGSYHNGTPSTADITIKLYDGRNSYRDSITYDLTTGEIMYDLVPPGRITDLKAVTGINNGEVSLNWTAPGDDGYKGAANRYEIRISDTVIDSNAKFNNAQEIPVNINPALNGTFETFNSTELEPGFWYFAIIAYDEVNRVSNLSNSAGAVAANWKPYVQDIIATDLNTGNSSLNLTTERGHDIRINYNVTDKNKDMLDISLWLNNGSGWFADRHMNQSWDVYNSIMYNYTINGISAAWKYYIAIDDGVSVQKVYEPEGAPVSYYYIGGSDTTTAGNITLTAVTGSTVNISIPFGGDFNNNNNAGVKYKLNASSGPWDVPNFYRDRNLVDYLVQVKDLNASTAYDFNITFMDADGVEGTENQYIYNVITAP